MEQGRRKSKSLCSGKIQHRGSIQLRNRFYTKAIAELLKLPSAIERAD